jgi:hypothetical protein
MPSITRTAVADADAFSDGTYTATGTTVRVGDTSVQPDTYMAIAFEDVQIDRYATINSASFTMSLATAPSSDATYHAHLFSAIDPTFPTTAAALRTTARTVAKNDHVILATAVNGSRTWEITNALQEQVNKSTWVKGSRIVVQLKGATSSTRRSNHVALETGGTAAAPQTLSVTFTPLPAVTGEATAVFPSSPAVAEGEVGTGGITGETTAVFGSAPADVEGFVGTPPAVTGQVVADFPSLPAAIIGSEADPKVNRPYAFALPLYTSHHIVTETGELHGFSANFDQTLGGVRDGVIGSRDDAWLAASGLTSRTPAPLQFVATLLNREDPEFDGDLLEDALPLARELHLPSGEVFDIWGGQKRARPADSVVDISLIPKGAYPRHPLLSGYVNAAFPTVGSTKRLPIYAIDPAGGITAPLTLKRAPYGMMAFGVRLTERGVIPLGSVGRPVEADGSFDPTSIALAYEYASLRMSLFGALSQVRENWLGPYGAVLVSLLFWRPGYAHLVTVSDAGLYHHDLPIGDAVDMSEQVLTAGVRADGVGSGAFMALGSASLGAPFFSLRAPSVDEAEEGALALYRKLTAANLSWEVAEPDITLELRRNDTKRLELAPGETLTLQFAVERIGPYTGPLTAVASSDVVTSAVASAGTVNGKDLYNVTLSAAANAPEGTYAFRLEVKASGADNEGSLLVGVRDAFDATVEVAAGPVIAPSATFVRLAFDEVQQRPTEILRDSSANANAFSWNDTARVNRRGTGILATGDGTAAVYSGTLQNASQPQRMAGEATYCCIIDEVALTKAGGVFIQLAGDGSENGVHLQRVTGGFAVRTVNGASTFTSPDTLAYSSGHGRLVLTIGTVDITLFNRDNGQSIRLARPTWPDAGMRFTQGALRSATGTFSQVSRSHILADTLHPYALSPLQARRNIDALLPYCPASDGKPEYPDSMIGHFRFDDNTAQLPNEKLRNKAAPALAIALTAVGAVSYPSGAVATPGGTLAYFTTGFVFPVAQVLNIITTVENFADAEPYNANFSVASSGVQAAAVEVSRGNGTNIVLRHQNGGDGGAGATWSARDLPLTKSGARDTLALEVSNGGKNSRLISLDTNQEVTRSGVGMSGFYNVSLGVVVRANGSTVEGQKIKNAELVICRGSVSPEARLNTRTLMRT